MSDDPAMDGDGPGLDRVTRHEDLVRLLAEQFARADVSLRELQARADRAGGVRLPRATCADMLAGRRFPKKAVMLAFLRGCRVPADQFPAWERAWERVRVAKLGQAAETTQPMDAIPPEPEPPRRGRGHATLPAALALLVAFSAVGAAAYLWLPERGTSDVRGRLVVDDGRAFGRGGSSRFTVSIDPANTAVRLTRRLDAGIGRQRAAITVNGVPAGTWEPLHVEHRHRWREQTVDLPPALTAGRRTLAVVNTFVSSDQDFNEFRYEVENQVDGVWKTSDVLDVGPSHLDDERAHGYRIDGPQTFAETQEFFYPPDQR
ncbi:hypothetical protein HII36_16120 [Nonomuraea sp. NN258]|uniref:hypothetical protein n=1 Tax=Nonomuraea antri TaxID=2730852 RepID=UPI001567F452|nr:hypothetical protein [Nonomuraea antri]NRQ33363.1 hypothetical protein [Nonomuraea antri]